MDSITYDSGSDSDSGQLFWFRFRLRFQLKKKSWFRFRLQFQIGQIWSRFRFRFQFRMHTPYISTKTSVLSPRFAVDKYPLMTHSSKFVGIFFDREAREIMYLVVSICPSFCLSVLSHKSYYQSKVFVCVSVISGCMRVIVRVQLICF